MSGSCPVPTALCCSSRSIPFPRSLLRSEGSRSSFSTVAAASCAFGSGPPCWWIPGDVGTPGPLAPAPEAGGSVSALTVFARTGTGGSPRSRRLRTSSTVAGDMPHNRAASRSDICDCLPSRSAARLRPSAVSIGRSLPSLPSRTLDCAPWPADRFLMAATVFAARPVTSPIARSDRCEWEAMIRSAAARRSGCDSGKPWATFSWTARRKTSASVSSKNMTLMDSRPCSDAAIRRCIPSMTRMVCLSTRIGGSGASVSTSRAMCALSSPFSRGESAGRSDRMGTDTTFESASAALRWAPEAGVDPAMSSLAGSWPTIIPSRCFRHMRMSKASSPNCCFNDHRRC